MNALTDGPVTCGWWPYRRGEVAETRVRAWLAEAWQLPAADLVMTRDAHGRPHLDAGQHHADLNWSHSGALLLAAWAEGGVRVGVDVELLRPRPRAMALAERFFHPDETAWLQALPNDTARELAFTRLWCAKEAVLKAHGRGLSFGLEKLRFTLDADGTPTLAACDAGLGAPTDWRLRTWVPADGYWATLAWRAGWPGPQG